MMGKLPVYKIEVWINEQYLTENEKEDGKNTVVLKGIGEREKMNVIDNVLTHGVGKDKGTALETIFPPHCISRILVTKINEK